MRISYEKTSISLLAIILTIEKVGFDLAYIDLS